MIEYIAIRAAGLMRSRDKIRRIMPNWEPSLGVQVIEAAHCTATSRVACGAKSWPMLGYTLALMWALGDVHIVRETAWRGVALA
jgi:hypothetical protein